MKNIFLVGALFIVCKSFAQCPFTVNLISSGDCPGAALTASAGKNISKIVWIKDGVTESTVTALSAYNPNGVTVAGGNGPGLADNQLSSPQGIFVDEAGDVIIADAGNNRIQEWSVGATFGITAVSSFGFGARPNQLNSEADVFVDGIGQFYISDYSKFEVQQWGFLGESGMVVAGGNGSGPAPGQLDWPVGLFVDLNENIYVADINNNRVQEWISGTGTAVTVAGGNGAGPGANQLHDPTAVFVDGNGNVYVVDGSNNRVQKWAPGATSGVTVAGGNGAGAGANQLNAPYGVYVDGNGNIFVADAGNNRVQEWAPGATAGITVAGGNGAGAAANQLNDPRWVWMDANENLYVSEDQNNRVQKFTLQSTINSNFVAPAPGVYTAMVSFTTGCTAASNPITIQGALTPSIGITASANPVNICTMVSFAAATTGAGIDPSYQWQVNGANAGTGGSVYQTSSLKDGDIVSCILTANDACISSLSKSSNNILIGVNGLPQANMVSKDKFCTGDTLAITSGDSLSQIVWSDNSAPVSTVTTTPVGTGITVAGGNGQGPADNQFYEPIDVVVDSAGNVFVADFFNWRVMKWAPGAASGVRADDNEQLIYPVGIAVDGADNLYVSVDPSTGVQEFAPGSSIGTNAAGGNPVGSAANELNKCGSVFVDAAGNVYVGDLNNYRVQKWARGAITGVTVAGGNGPGPDNDQLEPGSIFVDKAGNIYVVDSYYNRIEKWAPGATSGITILGPPALDYTLRGIFVDGAGNLYAADFQNNRVLKYAPGSTTGIVVAGGNGAGAAANQLNGPQSVFVDGKGDIYVADYFNNRVQEFLPHPIIDTLFKAASPGNYTAAVTTSGGCVLSTNTIVVNPFVTPEISVGASAPEVCANTPVTFIATPVNGGTAPVFKWQVNGTDAGSNSPIFTTSLGAGKSVIVCQLTSNVECSLQTSGVSSTVNLAIDPILVPSISINASSTDICSGAKADFTATPVNGGALPAYQWMVNGNPAGANSPDFNSNSLVNGDVVVCVLSGNATCASAPSATSNAIAMQVDQAIAPTVNITASADPVCSGKPVTFSATATNAGIVQNYQWRVNGTNTGTNDPVYSTTQLANGDIISCLLSTDNVCAAAASNSITMTVNPTPVIKPNQVFAVSSQGVTLAPVISGDIADYTWSPATGLSDISIADPVADPQRTTVYTLTVVSNEGCTASGDITAKLYTDIRIPGAFTPNGDGKNDIFYVLGGPQGSVIKDLSVFGRWGEMVFHVHDVVPGDPAFGWDGYYKGVPAATGTYVYSLIITLAGGKQELFKGVVILTR